MLKDKIIVVTGGTKGIGRELIKLFSPNNTVINLARSCEGKENEIVCDVTDEAQVKAAFGQIKEKYGRIDVLVNNAGYGLSGAVEMLPTEKVDAQFAVNFSGVQRCLRHALPLMGRGGRVINMSSVCAIFPLPFRSMYCASKAALSSMTFGLREELRPSGIKVTAICPGDTKTSFSANRDKVFATNERYGKRIKSADDHISAREEKRMSPEKVGKKIAKLISKKRYKPFYIVGAKYKVLYALYKIVPLSVILRCTGGMFNKGEK